MGGELYELTEHLHSVRKKLRAIPDGLDSADLRATQKGQVLAYLDEELRVILENKTACEEREKKEEEARQAAVLLPEPGVLDKILRYETKLERQLFRAINQLERLQRMRQGESVPPPLTVEVSERHSTRN